MNFDWKKLFALFALATALVVTGCGGDDEDGDDSGGEPLTAEEYGEQLPEILVPLGTELQDIGAATQAGESNEDAIEGVTQASDTLQTGIDDLNAIEPPEDAADAHDAMIAALEDFKASADEFAEVDPDDDAAAEEAATELQDAALQFQTDFGAAVSDLQSALPELEAPGTP